MSSEPTGLFSLKPGRHRTDSMKRFAVGVDLGGTNLKLGAIAEDGDLLEHLELAADARRGPEVVVGRMCRAILELRDRWVGRYRLAGIGVAVAGIMRLPLGSVIAAPNLPGWAGFNVRERIRQEMDAPFTLENDANAAALGEKWMGVAREMNHLAFLTLGTGIGGGLVLNGRIWHGAKGMAAELGHINIRPEGRLCNCGNRGCLEAYASATAGVRCATELADSGRASPKLERLVRGEAPLTADRVYALARQGDESAGLPFREMGTALGIGIASLIHIFDLEAVVLGGGAIEAWDAFHQPMFEEARRRSFVQQADPRPILRSGLGSRAGIYGAACLGFQGGHSARE